MRFLSKVFQHGQQVAHPIHERLPVVKGYWLSIHFFFVSE